MYGVDLSTVMMLDPAISAALPGAMGAAISEDGRYAYLATPRGALRVRVEDGRILELLRGPNTQRGLALSGGDILGWGYPPAGAGMYHVYRMSSP